MLIRLDVMVLVDVIWTEQPYNQEVSRHKIKKLQLRTVLNLLVIMLYMLPKEICHRDTLDLFVI